LYAWKKFKRGKGNKLSIQAFEYNLESEIIALHQSLVAKTYTPEPYKPFYVYDPKKRFIHKAEVIDRVVHQAVINIIEPLFDKKFIYDSYACRLGKGTHRAIARLRYFLQKASRNNTKKVWILKCDIKKFFDSIDHAILKEVLCQHIDCIDTRWLIDRIVDSFEKTPRVGLPLGNLTSQFFGNVYLHQLDFYIKHTLKVQYYVRYCDDMVLIGYDKATLTKYLEAILLFTQEQLSLDIHPNKIFIRSYTQGIDFLGYVLFPHHTILRKTTKKRIIRKWLYLNTQQQASYREVLQYCNSYKIQKMLTDS